MEYEDIENILNVYDFGEILEQNSLTEADVLLLLAERGEVELPNPKPLDFDD